MHSDTVRDRIRGIVASVLDLEVDHVPADADFDESLDADSLERVEIAVRIEREFELTLAPEEAVAVRTVEDAVALLRDRGVGTEPVDLVDRLVGRQLAAGHADRVAVVDPDAGPVTYAALARAAGAYAAALRRDGVAPGTRGLIVADDSVATVVAVLGLWWHGCVPVPLSPALTEPEIVFVAGDCGAGFVHLDAPAAKQAALARALGSLPGRTGEEVRATLGAQTPADVAAPAVWSAGAEALVQYTSGSTGTPKGVRHAATGIEAVLDGFGRVLALLPDDTVLSTAKMSFGYGFGNSVLFPLAAAARAVLLRGSVDPYAVTAAVRRHRVTVLCSVPRMYVALLGVTGGERASAFASLRLALSAGEQCPADLAERVQASLGVPLVNGLGATEVLHIGVATPPAAVVPGSTGIPVPGLTVTVRDEDGAAVPDGTEGRLHLAGPAVALGYLGRPGETARTFTVGGVFTGDIVRRTADGQLWHLCRTDDLLNLGGYKVAPGEIEAVVRTAGGVADCVVVGGIDEHGLEQAVVYAVPLPGADRAEVRRAIAGAVRRDLARFKRPARVEVVDALPVTSTGKVARYRLRDSAVRR